MPSSQTLNPKAMGRYALLLVSALIFSMITYSTALRNALFLTNDRIVHSYSHNQAHNIAQSVLVFALRDIQEDGGNIPIPSNGDTVEFGPEPWPEMHGSFILRITNSVDDDNLVHITSVGIFDGRSYQVNVGLAPGGGGAFPWPAYNNAIHTAGDLSFANGTVNGNLYSGGMFSIPANATINGDVIAVNTELAHVVDINSGTLNGSLYANTTNPNAITFSNWGGSITGDLFTGPGSNPGDVVQNASQWHPGHINGQMGSLSGLLPMMDVPVPEFPVLGDNYNYHPNISLQGNTNGNINLTSGDLYIPEISINSNTTLTINVGSEVRSLRVNNLNIQQGHLNINTDGDGRLEIFVENQFNIGGSSSMNNNFNPGGADQSAQNLLINYSGSDPLNFGGAQTVNANFFVESADVNLTGGNSFNGNIITLGENVEISGNAANSARVLYAPNAHIHMTGSGRVFGSVIGKSLSAQGNAMVTFSDDYKDSLPDLQSGSGSAQSYTIAHWN